MEGGGGDSVDATLAIVVDLLTPATRVHCRYSTCFSSICCCCCGCCLALTAIYPVVLAGHVDVVEPGPVGDIHPLPAPLALGLVVHESNHVLFPEERKERRIPWLLVVRSPFAKHFTIARSRGCIGRCKIKKLPSSVLATPPFHGTKI